LKCHSGLVPESHSTFSNLGSRVNARDDWMTFETAFLFFHGLRNYVSVFCNQTNSTMKSLLFILFVATTSVSFVSQPAQIFNTSLTITVRDEVGNTVSGAEVKLFKNEQDYLKEENVVMEATSDAKGLVKLKKLEGISYYVIVRKADKDNSGGGEIIGKLEEGKFNKATIVIQ